MWRSFVVVSEIVVLVFVLRLPFVQYMFKDAQDVVGQWYAYVATWQDRNELAELHTISAAQRDQLRPFQQEYVDAIMASRHSVQIFHKKFCGTDNINPYIHGAQLAQFGHSIETTGLLAMDY